MYLLNLQAFLLVSVYFLQDDLLIKLEDITRPPRLAKHGFRWMLENIKINSLKYQLIKIIKFF